jgi:hypothetical protein
MRRERHLSVFTLIRDVAKEQAANRSQMAVVSLQYRNADDAIHSSIVDAMLGGGVAVITSTVLRGCTVLSDVHDRCPND